MPLPLAKVLSLTLLELWALVPESQYIARTGMTLLIVRVGCRGWLIGWPVGCGCMPCNTMPCSLHGEGVVARASSWCICYGVASVQGEARKSPSPEQVLG